MEWALAWRPLGATVRPVAGWQLGRIFRQRRARSGYHGSTRRAWSHAGNGGCNNGVIYGDESA